MLLIIHICIVYKNGIHYIYIWTEKNEQNNIYRYIYIYSPVNFFLFQWIPSIAFNWIPVNSNEYDVVSWMLHLIKHFFVMETIRILVKGASIQKDQGDIQSQWAGQGVQHITSHHQLINRMRDSLSHIYSKPIRCD